MSALRFTSLNQLARLATGPVVLVLLPVSLSPEQQGYWFMMTSITAFVAFADMGLSNALIQFAAHEHARLLEARARDSATTKQAQFRLDSLRRFAWARASTVSLWVLPTVMGIGLWMLSGRSETVRWTLPWIAFCATSVASLFLMIVLAFHEGCNDVARIQRLRAQIAGVNAAILAFGLLLGLGLWTLPLATGTSSLLGFHFLWKHRHNDRKIPSEGSSDEIRDGVASWSTEVSPLLARYAASWLGGYAMFQLFTPIVFRMEGAVQAGQVGLTISVFTAIFTLSNVWSAHQLPRFAMAIAMKDERMLSGCMRKALVGSMLTYCVLTALALGAYLVLRTFPQATERLLEPIQVFMLAAVWGLQVVVHNLAVYLRAFKEEPLVWHTLLAAAHTVVGTALSLTLLGIPQLFLGLLSVYLWFIPAVLLLYVRKRSTTLAWPDPGQAVHHRVL